MKHLLYLLFILLSLQACRPQYELILIHQGTPLTSFTPCEPSIAINPNKPDEAVAGAVLNMVYRSSDGGATWYSDHLISPLGVYGDPCVIADVKNNFYYFHLGDPAQKGWDSPAILESIVVQKSSDGGRTWNDGAPIGKNPPKDQDKEWAVVDPRNNNIYCTWTEFDTYGQRDENCKSRILFSHSTDEGATWSDAQRISSYEGNCIDDDFTVEGAVPAVGPQGEIYVAWAFNEKIYFNKSLDQGQTWLPEEVAIIEQQGGWVIPLEQLERVNGLPITICDLSSGTYNGRIYVNWCEEKNKQTDVMISYSDDAGKTWSTPTCVHPKKLDGNQFFTWISIDQTTGYLYTVYYDGAGLPSDQVRVSISSSMDGGRTWKQQKLKGSNFVLPHENAFFGDYNNIAAHDGRVLPIWTRNDEQGYSVWTAIRKK